MSASTPTGSAVRVDHAALAEAVLPEQAALPAKDPEERRRRILAAAVQVLKDKGFAGARISDVASAAGTSPALVVYHFGTLDGVLVEALSTVEDAFYDDLAHAMPPKADAVEHLRVLADLGTSSGPGVGDWTLWMEVWVRSLRDGQAAALRRDLDARWRRTLLEVIEAGVAQGHFRTRHPDVSAVHLAALMDGLAVQVSLGDPEVDEARMREVWLDAAASELAANERVVRALVRRSAAGAAGRRR